MCRLTLTALAIAAAAQLCYAQQGIITTFAGNGTRGFSGDGGPAISAQLGAGGVAQPLGVAADSAGNVYIVDGSNNRIRKVNAAGIISTVAGGGTTPGVGDGSPATSVQIFPQGVATDRAGNLYIAAGATIRKVNAAGILSTVAGGISPGFSGDGGPATSAQIFPTGVAADNAGNIFIADTINQRIRKVNTSGIISTYAGNGTQGFSGDGGPATSAALTLPQGLSVDAEGNIYFAVLGRIRKVDTAGIITTVAGNGSGLAIGDGGPAINAGMAPTFTAVDSEGNIFLVDAGANRIRKVNTAGIITLYAGSGLNTGQGNGDGGPATSAVLSGTTGVAVDGAGNVYIAESNNNRIRKVSSGTAGSPISPTPASLSFSHSIGGAAPPSQSVVIIAVGATLTYTASTSASWLSVSPTSGPVSTTLTVSVNPAGLAAGTYNGIITLTPSGSGNPPRTIPVILNVNAPISEGVITTIAGAGNTVLPFSGDGGPAVNAGMTGPIGVAVDSAGNIYLADAGNNRIRKVSASGIMSTFAGDGAYAFGGDGGPATRASLFTPTAVAVDAAGNVYIADTVNHRVRKVNTAGIISTVAGNGNPSFSGDGGQAASASLTGPAGVALDSAGNLYIADLGNSRIRKVNTAGIISTIAGSLLAGFSGDGGPATSARLFAPAGVAVDTAGNVYILEAGNATGFGNRIRKVTTAGIISTIAGNGTRGFSGDGGPAGSAVINPFSSHAGMAVDGAGNLYFADVANHRIRKISASGIISTVAGNGIAGFSGDGGPATTAGLNNPNDVAVDSAGNIYIADTTNLRLRKVGPAGQPPGPGVCLPSIVNGASLQPGVSPSSWATIQGCVFASSVETWDNFIVDGRLPTTLGGVTVTIGGKPAYLNYVSPDQINLIVPDIEPGSAQVTISGAGGRQQFTTTIAAYAPAFFVWPGSQAVATRADYTFAAKAGTFAGATTVPARPGDVIILWGAGFGSTTPPAPAGVVLPADRTYATSTSATVTINNIPVTVYGAALAPGFAGLFQVAVQVPASLADGDWPVAASVGGAQSPTGIVLSVRR